jgi:hypothetical protein
VKNCFIAVDDEGMTGIVATLKADDDISLVGKKIDDFTFAFITPLGADDRDVCHCTSGVRREA